MVSQFLKIFFLRRKKKWSLYLHPLNLGWPCVVSEAGRVPGFPRRTRSLCLGPAGIFMSCPETAILRRSWSAALEEKRPRGEERHPSQQPAPNARHESRTILALQSQPTLQLTTTWVSPGYTSRDLDSRPTESWENNSLFGQLNLRVVS